MHFVALDVFSPDSEAIARARFRDKLLVLGAGAGAGAVSWLCMWWRQVAGAGAGAVSVVGTGCWRWCRAPVLVL